jgi:hypothetical protein
MSEAPQLPRNHAWSGTLEGLVATEAGALLARLKAFVPDAGAAQERAWRSQIADLQREGAQVLAWHAPAHNDHAVLEYALPREAGRRPDVLILQNGQVVVLEFKETSRPRRADLDQVAAYARDLRGYHSACEGVEVIPVLVLGADYPAPRLVDGVQVVSARHLAKELLRLGRGGEGSPIELNAFLNGEYAPLPTLVAAARLLFDNMPLPFIKRAQSAGVQDAVLRILAEARTANANGQRCLVVVTGVPGAGKTLVGLQAAHSAALEVGYRFGDRRKRGAPATFLSGNGPLVQVLQNALRSTAFVQDMHRFIREYGLEFRDRVPPERLIVFDEAQRAWDEPKMRDFYGKKLPGVPSDMVRSEPETLVQIAERMTEGAVVVALVGRGQEIHTGEEAGMAQWAAALATSRSGWRVVGPPDQEAVFTVPGVTFERDAALDLDTGLRYHAGDDMHRWVEAVIDRGDLAEAQLLAGRLRSAAFPIYVTRDLEAAKSYAVARFGGQPQRRYGIVASSKSERHLLAYGLETGFQATKRLRIGEWFNAEPAHPRSCCQWTEVVTEFQCQGLELDIALVAWSDDFWWQGQGWASRVGARQRLVRDPHQLRKNAYRVLLTRGREGLVIFVPPAPESTMDATFEALLQAGALEARAAREEQMVA